MQAQTEAAVRLLGFTPSPNAYNAPQLTLTLAEPKYQSPKEGLYVTEANIAPTLRIDVQNAGRRYSGRYGASLNQRFGMAPNEQTNTKLVSWMRWSGQLTRIQYSEYRSTAGAVTLSASRAMKKPAKAGFLQVASALRRAPSVSDG